MAKATPVHSRKRSILGFMTGRMEILGDLNRPLWTEEQWKELERERAEQAKAWEREWREHGTISGKKTSGQPPHLAKGKAEKTVRRTAKG